MIKINSDIEYIPCSDEPLSAEVYFIHGEKYCYIFDVGDNEFSRNAINAVCHKKVIILSHCHKDHTGNIDKISYEKLYVGKLTKDTIQAGCVVDERLSIDDGIQIDIIPCTSPHVDGSLIVVVNREYALIADLYFTRTDREYDKEKAYQMLNELESVDTKYFVVSHQEARAVYEKESLIAQLREYFSCSGN